MPYVNLHSMKSKKNQQKIFQELLDEIIAVAKNFEKAEQLLNEAEAMLKAHSHIKPNALLLVIRANSFYNKGKNDVAIKTINEAITLAEKEQNGSVQAKALRLKVMMLHYKGSLQEAMQCAQKAIVFFHSTGELYEEATCYHSLSIIYNEMGQFDQCIEASEKAIITFKSSGVSEAKYAEAFVNTTVARASMLRRIGITDKLKETFHQLLKSKEFSLSSIYAQSLALNIYAAYLADNKKYKESNKLLYQVVENLKGKSESDHVKAELFLARNMIALKQYDKAIQHLNFVIRFYRANQDTHLLVTLFMLVQVLWAKQDLKALKATLKEIDTIAQKATSDFHLWQYNEEYAKFYETTKEFEKAFKHQQLAHQYELKCVRFDYDKKLESIHQEYTLREKEQQNQILQKDIEMKKQELTLASDFLNQKIALLKELKTFMSNMQKENMQKNEMMKVMNKRINAVINIEHEQQLFREKIEQTANDYTKKIRKKYPQLSLTEAKICSFLRNDFSNKEIANLMVASIRTIENHRYNIRKKLGVKGDENLSILLNDFDIV